MTEDSFSFPREHLAAPSAVKAPKTTTELFEVFDRWLSLGGHDSRAGLMGRSSVYLARPLPKDLAVLLEVTSQTAALLAWLNGQIADAEAFQRCALALFTQEVAIEEELEHLTTSERKVMVQARASLYMKVARNLDRLSATATHRLETLRTQVATERKLAGLGGGGA